MNKDFYKEAFENRQELVDMLREDNEKLKKENEFLRQRENKLQLIEQMFTSGTVDLNELHDLVMSK